MSGMLMPEFWAESEMTGPVGKSSHRLWPFSRHFFARKSQFSHSAETSVAQTEVRPEPKQSPVVQGYLADIW